jgi:hypothetical protein
VITARECEKFWPDLPWREPVVVTSFDRPKEARYACRYCIAMKGLRGDQVPDLPRDRAAVIAHIEAEHE